MAAMTIKAGRDGVKMQNVPVVTWTVVGVMMANRWERACPGSEHDADSINDKGKTTGGQRTAGTMPAVTSG